MIAEAFGPKKDAAYFGINELNTDIPAPEPRRVTQAQPLGVKYDSDKPKWSLIPKGVVGQVVEVLTFGAKKYSPDNWMYVPQERYYDALNRHLDAWHNGETRDPETGKHHLAHALSCLMFMLWLDQNLPPSR